ncbi:MAG: hypothetical protein VX938_02540 [Myxococcota bacterium]|nr:hypothetical protein [Myxococcota bacterium]
MHHGFVVGSRRVLGLGGAYTAVAEGADGLAWTPAAFANRPRSVVNRTSATADLGISLSLSGVDMDGDGITPEPEDQLTARTVFFGLSVLTSDMGLGVYAQVVEGAGDRGDTDSLNTINVGLGAGWAIRDGEFVVGIAMELLQACVGLSRLGLPEEGCGSGVRGHLGLLYRPPGAPLRLGASLRSGAELGLDSDGLVASAATDPLPTGFHMPRRLNLGFSYMFGPAAPGWNFRMSDDIGWGEAVRLADSRYLLLTVEVSHLARSEHNVITGESFLAEQDRRLMQEGSVSLHLGVESEAVRERLRTRLGLYTVPNRAIGGVNDTAGGQGVHLTGGFDVRLMRLRVVDLRLSVQFDVAGDTYRNFGLGLGFWEPSIGLKRSVGIPATL